MRHVLLVAMTLAASSCGLFRIFDGDGDEPPRIDFEDSSPELTDARSVDLIAHVQHPKGDDFVASGVLLLRDGTEVAAFANVVADQWVVPLDWDTLSAVEPIVTDVDEQWGISTDEPVRISLIAVFVTDKGVEGTQTIEVSAHCDEGVSCDGTCIDLRSDPDNCGECGNTCSACDDGECSDLGPCVSGVRHDGRTMDDVCQEVVGGSCRPSMYDGMRDIVVVTYQDSACQGTGEAYEDGFDGWLDCNAEISWSDGTYFRPMCVVD